MTMLEPAAGVRLVMPDEPETLRCELRDVVLAGGDWRQGFSDDVCLGVWLWERWMSTLEPAGMDREAFLDVVTAYRREVWFWLLGDRGWRPFIEGLAGRVARRLPAR
jgi:hypothetical protein